MHPGALLDRATELLRAVLAFQAPADDTVSAYFRRHHELGPRERRVLADTVFAVLRRRRLFEHLAQESGGALERRLAILAWQGGGSVPEAALQPQERQWLAQARAVDPATLPAALQHNLPEWLAEALHASLGEAGFRALAASLLDPAPLNLRVNVLKAHREQVVEALAQAGVQAAPTPYSPWGLRVAGKPSLGGLDLVRRGEVEIQDEGSQLLALLTDPKRNEMVVDFCAGAGGKTLALGAAMRNTGRLYAYDVSAHRLRELQARLGRAGLTNVYAVQIAHERDERILRLVGKVDRVLVDAPCSGLGTLRRNPDLKWRQTPSAVQEMQARQRAILEAAGRLVKPGGRLVYATCSLLDAENEGVAEDFGAAHPEFDPQPAAELLRAARVQSAADLDTQGWMRLWPHRHGTDGFFAAAWRRKR